MGRSMDREKKIEKLKEKWEGVNSQVVENTDRRGQEKQIGEGGNAGKIGGKRQG